MSDSENDRLKNNAFAHFRRMPIAAAIQTSLLGLGVTCAPVHAANIIVTSNTDDGSMCTLREAISSVNSGQNSGGCSNSGGEPFGTNDTITFANPGEIRLASGELAVGNDVSINASSVSGVTVNAMQNSRVIFLANETSLSISDLTLTGGSASYSGGAIYGGEGSALTLIDSTITDNESGNYGGGLFLYGYGASANIINSEFSNNTAGEDGGAIYLNSKNGNTLTLTNSRVVNNVAIQGEAGGIWSNGYSDVISLTGSVVMNNTAGTEGGGIYAYAGTLELTNTTVSGNSAPTDGGGIFAGSLSKVTIQSSTIVGNIATEQGGGISSQSGTLSLTNSTVSGNRSGRQGGGIFTDSETTLSHTTLSDNRSNESGGGVYARDTLTLINSILANSVGGEDCFLDGAQLNVDSQTIIEKGFCGGRIGDPGLLPLANNGGPTLTHALAPDSMARDTGDNSTCLARDQRGFARNDGACDVGAFEVQDDGGFFVIPLKNGKTVVIPE